MLDLLGGFKDAPSSCDVIGNLNLYKVSFDVIYMYTYFHKCKIIYYKVNLVQIFEKMNTFKKFGRGIGDKDWHLCFILYVTHYGSQHIHP